MMPDLDEALRELRDRRRAEPPPATLEGRLRAAVRARNRSRRFAPVWVGAVAASGLLVFALLQPRQTVAPQPPPPQMEGAFVALPSGVGLPPPSATAVLRMQLKRADLPQYGVASPGRGAAVGEFVNVDFLVGDDGLARAARVAP